MPIERRYKKGSITYFEHEEGKEIFVMKSGRMDISFEDPQTGEKITKTLNEGEFFGLKSAIIGHTRDEMAEAVTDCIVIVFSTPEFESFVAKKVELMKRLLRVLSNQLRNLGIKVNNYLGNNILYPPNVGLFKIGEYYLNNKSYRQAIQVYERYKKAYGETNLAEEADYRIEIAKEAIKTGFLKKFKSVDEIIQQDELGTTAGIGDSKESLVNTHSKLGLREFMNGFYKAESFFNGEDYVNAEKEFKSLFAEESKIVSIDLRNKARLMYIETLHRQNKYKDCIALITSFVKTVKDPTMVKKALFVFADIYITLKNQEGAMAILNKIVLMAPIDDLSKQARAKLTKIKVSGV